MSEENKAQEQILSAMVISHFSHEMIGGFIVSSVEGYRNYNLGYVYGFQSSFIDYGTGDPDFNLMFESSWIADSGKLYWYRILCCCGGSATFTPEELGLGFTSPRGLIANPVSYSDLISSQVLTQEEIDHRISSHCVRIFDSGKYPKCKQKLQMITAVAARNLSEVCEVLKNPKFGPAVDFQVISIKKYKDPITGGGVRTELEEQEFCNIPECVDLCLDFDLANEASVSENSGPYRPYIFEMTASFTRFAVESNINLQLLGSAQILYFWYDSEGGAEISGSSSLVSSKFNYNFLGNIVFSNEIDFLINPIIRNFSGSIDIGGIITDVISPRIQYNSKLQLVLESDSSIKYIIPFCSYASLKVTGQAEVEILNISYEFDVSGDIYMNGSNDLYLNHYEYQGDGQINLYSNLIVISGYRTYESQGSISISGSNDRLGRCIETTGNLSILGSSQSKKRPAFNFTGNIGLAGSSSDIITSNRVFRSAGELIQIYGNTDNTNDDLHLINFKNVGLLVSEASFYSSFLSASVDFASPESFSDLSINQGSVNTCGCLNVGLTISLNNNLSNAGVLGSFLEKNSLTLSPNLILRYKKSTNSWFLNQNFRGKSDDDQDVFWQLIFDLSCTNIIENQEFDDYYLKFNFISKYTKLGKTYQSNFLVNMNSNSVCVSRNGELSTNITINTDKNMVLVDGIDTNYKLSDGVGLFSNSYWNNKLNYSKLRTTCKKSSVPTSGGPLGVNTTLATGYQSYTPSNVSIGQTYLPKGPEVVGNFPQFRINYTDTAIEYCTTELSTPTAIA